jgi:uncharacterized protein YgiM (DUF1202 family)
MQRAAYLLSTLCEALLSAPRQALRRAVFTGLGLVLLLALGAEPSRAAERPAERLQVVEPYLEMHTGPGRGYPVFFVVERSQWVAIESRSTDWYRVRAEGGQLGWVQRQQLESTLTAAGNAKTFRDLLIDDYLSRRLEFSGSWGRFSREPMLKLSLHYRLADAVGAELTVGQVQGLFSGTEFWHLALTSEPWSDRRWSPFFAVGLGRFKNIPNTSLVDAVATDAKLGQATLGLRWHLAERFTARLDWTLYTAYVSDARSTEYRSLTAGLGFFF